jgi:hypothetical protein
MRFKVDENLPVELADMLRQADHDATTVGEQHVLAVFAGIVPVLVIEPLDQRLWIVEEQRIRIRS